jgi:hypothetical protein
MVVTERGARSMEARRALIGRIESDADAWRHRLKPMVEQALGDERRGRKGSREGLALALRDALNALDAAA